MKICAVCCGVGILKKYTEGTCTYTEEILNRKFCAVIDKNYSNNNGNNDNSYCIFTSLSFLGKFIKVKFYWEKSKIFYRHQVQGTQLRAWSLIYMY